MKIVGNKILLDGNEFAMAIDAYLVAHGISVSGPRTVSVIMDNEDTYEKAIARDVEVEVYVDPSGRVVDNH